MLIFNRREMIGFLDLNYSEFHGYITREQWSDAYHLGCVIVNDSFALHLFQLASAPMLSTFKSSFIQQSVKIQNNCRSW
jgi:hypothetical protein